MLNAIACVFRRSGERNVRCDCIEDLFEDALVEMPRDPEHHIDSSIDPWTVLGDVWITTLSLKGVVFVELFRFSFLAIIEHS